MQGRTAFLTGGTGFIGLNLAEQLTRSGWEVVALHRPGSNTGPLRRFPVRLAEGAIESPADLARAMPEGVDAVFHVAGDVSQWSGHRERQWRTNVEGTRNMVEAALARGARKFVHTSSIAAYGMQRAPFDETAPKLGVGSFNYQSSKAAAEAEVLKGVSAGLDGVLMNPANVIGRYDRGTWSQFIRLAANRKMFRIPPGGACFCDVDAVVRAHIAAVDKGQTGHNYLLGGEEASYADIVRLVGELLGVRTNRMVGRPIALRVAGRVSDWASKATRRMPVVSPESAAMLCARIVCRSEKAIRELGYAPRPIEAMLRECLEWLVAERILVAPPGSPLAQRSREPSSAARSDSG